MICPECGVEFKGGAFTVVSKVGTGRMRRCPNAHEFPEPQRVRIDKRDALIEQQQKRIAELTRILVIAERHFELIAETEGATSACRYIAEWCSAALAEEDKP